MATPTKITTKGEFKKDTAKGKKHYSIEHAKAAGAIYLTPEAHKELGSPDTIKVTVEAA